jgi:uncharacterized membrane protein YciS (DUF1049 family)
MNHELVEARVEEATAQRKYDMSTVVASTFLTVLGLALPLMVASFLYIDGQSDQLKSAADQRIQVLQTRHDQLEKDCLTAMMSMSSATTSFARSVASSVRGIYCRQRDDAAEELQTQREQAQRLADDGVDMLVPYLAIGTLALIGGAWVVDFVHRRSGSLQVAQARRIVEEALEAEAATVKAAQPSQETSARASVPRGGARRRVRAASKTAGSSALRRASRQPRR